MEEFNITLKKVELEYIKDIVYYQIYDLSNKIQNELKSKTTDDEALTILNQQQRVFSNLHKKLKQTEKVF